MIAFLPIPASLRIRQVAADLKELFSQDMCTQDPRYISSGPTGCRPMHIKQVELLSRWPALQG